MPSSEIIPSHFFVHSSGLKFACHFLQKACPGRITPTQSIVFKKRKCSVFVVVFFLCVDFTFISTNAIVNTHSRGQYENTGQWNVWIQANVCLVQQGWPLSDPVGQCQRDISPVLSHLPAFQTRPEIQNFVSDINT